MACGSQHVHTFIKAVNSLSLDLSAVGGVVEARKQGSKKQTDSNPISVVNFLRGLGQTFCNCEETYWYSYSIAIKCE